MTRATWRDPRWAASARRSSDGRALAAERRLQLASVSGSSEVWMTCRRTARSAAAPSPACSGARARRPRRPRRSSCTPRRFMNLSSTPTSVSACRPRRRSPRRSPCRAAGRGRSARSGTPHSAPPAAPRPAVLRAWCSLTLPSGRRSTTTMSSSTIDCSLISCRELVRDGARGVDIGVGDGDRGCSCAEPARRAGDAGSPAWGDPARPRARPCWRHGGGPPPGRR